MPRVEPGAFTHRCHPKVARREAHRKGCATISGRYRRLASEGDCGGLLFLERFWTADERAVPKIKSQEAVRIPRNADPNALPDFAGFVVSASEP